MGVLSELTRSLDSSKFRATALKKLCLRDPGCPGAKRMRFSVTLMHLQSLRSVKQVQSRAGTCEPEIKDRGKPQLPDLKQKHQCNALRPFRLLSAAVSLRGNLRPPLGTWVPVPDGTHSLAHCPNTFRPNEEQRIQSMVGYLGLELFVGWYFVVCWGAEEERH